MTIEIDQVDRSLVLLHVRRVQKHEGFSTLHLLTPLAGQI
jgi:hypothetical protein